MPQGIPLARDRDLQRSCVCFLLHPLTLSFWEEERDPAWPYPSIPRHGSPAPISSQQLGFQHATVLAKR